MLGPTKPYPRIGAAAVVAQLSGEQERVTVVEVHDGGRRVVVSGAHGAPRGFTLRRATAAFVQEGREHAPRLRLLD